MNLRSVQNPHATARARGVGFQWWSAPVAFLATLLALPVNAGITLPDDPLTTTSRVAPNVLFILDDSGSMEETSMPSTPPATTAPNVANLAYTRNTLSYNPGVSYQAWTQASGDRMTGGVAYTGAYSDLSLASGNINLASATRTFYVPKNTASSDATYLGAGTNYYRYQITPDGRIYRSEWLTSGSSTSPTVNGTLGTAGTTNAGNYSNIWNVLIPPYAYGLTFASSGGTVSGTNRGADLYIRSGNQTVNINNNYTSRGLNNGNAESVAGAVSDSEVTWYARLYAQTNFGGTVTVGYTYSLCATGSISGAAWRNCTEVSSIPNTGRSTVAAELTNYATWYSYHRTRMKAAKAGAGDAFRGQGNKVRVGFRTIWGRNTFDIPVGDGNDGRFVNNMDDPNTVANESTTSRSTWYSRLYGAEGSGYTPLRTALRDAGAYFSLDTNSGPYGPQARVSQFSCRQNFTILTTDGYWNDDGQGGRPSFDATGTGDQDGTAGATITGPNEQTFTYTPGAPFRDGATTHSNTLADVAMRYWKGDLRSDLINNVPATPENPAFWQHMVTFGISIGLSGTSGRSSVDDVPANATWNNPLDGEDGDRIDDLLHAAVNGRGAFVSASNPKEFAAGLSQALDVIAKRTSSYSNVATNSTSLNTGAQVFSASYTSGTWVGSVTARSVTRAGVSDTVAWTASIPTWSTRRVFTSNGTSGSAFPTSSQVAALLRTGGPVDYPVTGTENANYLKGDASKEERNGGLLRNRATLLGDVVGSSPAYVKDTNTVYVGANDGMLHAFDAANGNELFAYVPSILNFNHLATLSRGDYTHKFFVDGPVAVSNRTLTPGRNTLVGTLGRGGKGLYALNVSAPASFGGTDFKWELADTPAGNMGLVLGAPVLAQVRNGASSPAVVIGNGVNSTTERAVLIVLNLDTGAVIREIDTGVGSTLAPNGLSAPTGVYAADGKTLAYVYAGDMQGNVWKFDLRSTSPAAWSATRLFTAAKPGVTQPITSGITLATDPATNARWVFFGTGRFMTTSDADDKSTFSQSIYGVKDEDVAYARADLTARTITVTDATSSGYPVRAFQTKEALPLASKGWYVDLPAAGERIVQDAQIVSNFLVTASMIPEGNACESSGTGYINALDAFTGTSGGTSFFNLDNGTTTDDTAVGGLPVGSVNLGVGMPTRPVLLPGQIVLGGSGDGSAAGLGGSPTFGMRWQRVSWREVRQD
jgi:type IV pilus assembly protein PilY1